EAPAEDGGGFFLDCPRALAPTLVEKLNFYKLRAKVICEDLSEVLGVMAVWGGMADSKYGLSYPDPRLPALGSRVMLPPHLAAGAPAALGARVTDADRCDTHRRALPRCQRLCPPSHGPRRTPGGPRLRLRRHVPARSRYGPTKWRRFRQGLL